MAIDQHGDAKLDGVSIRSLPKVSLHDHLDGALRPATVVDLAAQVGHELPTTDPASGGTTTVWAAAHCSAGASADVPPAASSDAPLPFAAASSEACTTVSRTVSTASGLATPGSGDTPASARPGSGRSAGARSLLVARIVGPPTGAAARPSDAIDAVGSTYRPGGGDASRPGPLTGGSRPPQWPSRCARALRNR